MLSRKSQDFVASIHKQVQIFLEGTSTEKSQKLSMG